MLFTESHVLTIKAKRWVFSFHLKSVTLEFLRCDLWNTEWKLWPYCSLNRSHRCVLHGHAHIRTYGLYYPWIMLPSSGVDPQTLSRSCRCVNIPHLWLCVLLLLRWRRLTTSTCSWRRTTGSLGMCDWRGFLVNLTKSSVQRQSLKWWVSSSVLMMAQQHQDWHLSIIILVPPMIRWWLWQIKGQILDVWVMGDDSRSVNL